MKPLFVTVFFSEIVTMLIMYCVHMAFTSSSSSSLFGKLKIGSGLVFQFAPSNIFKTLPLFFEAIKHKPLVLEVELTEIKFIRSNIKHQYPKQP